MWKHWVNGILGILVILLPYAGLPWGFHKVLLFASGVLIAVFSFWSISEYGRSRNGSDNIAE